MKYRLFRWLFSFLVALFLLPTPASSGQSAAQLTVINALKLDNLCAVIDMAQVVAGEYRRIGSAVGDIPSGIGGASRTSNQIGDAAEEQIRERLQRAGLPFEAEVPFKGASGNARRGDFVVKVKVERAGIVNIESKNVARITKDNFRQIWDYGDHTIVAVRRGARVSRGVAHLLKNLSTHGLITVLDCAFLI